MDRQLFAATMQRSFDRFDPGSFAEYLLTEPLDDAPARPLLFQAGLGDVSVPNLGTFLHARLVGIPLVEPSPAEVYGLETTEGPAPAGLTLIDFGIDLSIYDQAEPAAREQPGARGRAARAGRPRGAGRLPARRHGRPSVRRPLRPGLSRSLWMRLAASAGLLPTVRQHVG